MTIASVPDYQNVDLQFKVEHLTNVQTVTNIACFFMEIYQGLMSLRVLLFNVPAFQSEVIFRHDAHIFIQHVSFTRMTIRFRIVLWISERLIGRIRNVKHAVLHKVDHD